MHCMLSGRETWYKVTGLVERQCQAVVVRLLARLVVGGGGGGGGGGCGDKYPVPEPHPQGGGGGWGAYITKVMSMV